MGPRCSKKGEYTATSTEDDDFQHVEGSRPLTITERYLKAEFMAMDSSGDGMLTRDQFVQLLMVLGYGRKEEAEALLRTVNKDDNASLTLDEYNDAMKNPDVLKRTSLLRNLFSKFDDNKDGKARRDQIEQGFRDMGIEVDDEMKKDIADMDENKDGNVLYQDFVYTQLKKKGVVSS